MIIKMLLRNLQMDFGNQGSTLKKTKTGKMDKRTGLVLKMDWSNRFWTKL